MGSTTLGNKALLEVSESNTYSTYTKQANLILAY